MTEPLPSINARDVHGFCPACGHPTLSLGEDGRITCTLMDCPRPDLVNELIGEIGDARNHAGYTFCSQLVGHVTMTAFAKKITEKVTAVAHRAEAVEYANEQKQRVIGLYEQWVKAGPPPIGTPMSRWWDRRLAELHNAIHPPTDQTQERP